MAEKVIIFEADIKIDEAVAETARLKEEVTKLHFETEKLKRSQGETSEAYIKSKATLDNANKSLKQHEGIVKTVVAQNNQNTEAVGKFDDVTKNATKRLREINVEMANMAAKGEQNTEKFRQLQQEGGHLRDSLDEVRTRIKLYASDTRQLDQAIMVFQGIGAAAQIAESAQALLGTENEDLTRSIQKLVAIQGAMNGLQEIQNMLQKESGVMILANSIKMKALAAAQAIYSTAVGTSTGALKLFRVALLSTGIGAIVVGIGLLIANWDKLTGSVDAGTKAIDGNRIANDEARESHNKSIKEIRDLKIEYDILTGKITDAEAEVLRLKNEYNDSITAISNDTEKGIARATGWWSKFKDGIMAAGNPMLTAKLQARRVADELAIGAKKIEEINRVQREKEKIANERLRQENEQARNDESDKEDKRTEDAIKAYKNRIKAENDVKEALLKSEIEFFNEVEKVRAEITKRDLERIENYNDDIFAEFEDERNREAELEAKKAQRLVERLNTNFENEMAILEMNEATKFKARKMWLDAQKVEELKKAKEIGADTQLINDKYRAMDLELERAKIDAKLALSANFMGNLATLFGEGTAIGKAAAITETIINTYKGAQAAYASLSSIPVVGPALGAVAAAAQIKVGFDNVKKIKAAGKGGGGGGGAGATTASAPIANAVNPSVSMGAVSGAVGTSTGQMVTNAVDSSAKTQIAVVVDDVTAKQNQKTNANKLATL